MSATPRPALRCLIRPWLVGGAIALLGTGCGGDDPPGASSHVRAWRRATLEQVPRPAAATLHEGLLLVLGAGDRSLYVVERTALVPGGLATARKLPLDVVRTNPLEGHGSGERSGGFAGQGYRLGVLWDQPLELVGLAVRRVKARGAGADMEALYVLERTYGVVWWGRLERDADGHVSAARLSAAFVVPERPRAGAPAGEWRDSGSGLAALAIAGGLSKDDDLVTLTRKAEGSRGLRLDLLDRFGMRLGGWGVDPNVVGEVEVRALAFDGARHVLLLGPGRGTLHVLPATGERTRLTAELATPPVPPEDATVEWTTLAAGDGAWFALGRRGDVAVVAWR
jgi:hypothetical protein